MRAGKDFPSLFDQDNYASRHTTGCNLLDPESLITGAEIAKGLSYDNSHRDFWGPATYELACSGDLSTEVLVDHFPRICN
jgi:hypothetical protein